MTAERITAPPPSRLERAVVGFSIAWFLLAGLLLIPYPGVENDEALFANAIYAPEGVPGRISLLGRSIPTMVMPYVGALKGWLYSDIFRMFHPSVWSLRTPVLFAGAAAIWFFYLLLRRLAGPRSAVIGCVLLATDVPFLLTVTFDWGPVALQMLLLISGLFLAVRYRNALRLAHVAGAFFLFGLALWDKAVFLWTAAGLVAAALAFARQELRRVYRPQAAAVAVVCLLAGALPFLAYNFGSEFATFRGNRYGLADYRQKVAVMRATLSGTVLDHFLIDRGSSPARSPALLTPLEAAGLRLNSLPHPSNGFLPLAVLAAGLLAPIGWRRPGGRVPWFFALAFLVSWLSMMGIVNAGGGAHHTILVWPQLIGFVGAGLGLGSQCLPKRLRPLLGAGVAAVVVVNVFLWSNFYAGLIRFGPGKLWTDAIHPLVECVGKIKPHVVYSVDWGMDFSLRMFLRGSPPIDAGVGLFPPVLDDGERSRLRYRFSRPGAVFVGYVDGQEVFPEGKRIVQQYADEQNYSKTVLCQASDRRGRPFFEVYRYVPKE